MCAGLGCLYTDYFGGCGYHGCGPRPCDEEACDAYEDYLEEQAEIELELEREENN